MTNRLLNLTRQQFAFFICCGMMVALIYSKFALTVGMILLLLSSLINLQSGGQFKVHFNPQIKSNFQKLWKRKDFLIVTIFFLIVLVSGVYSSDFNYLGERLRIKLPFLLLPFAFVSFPPFTKRQYHSLFYFFIIVVALSAIPVGVNFWLNYESIHAGLGKGGAVPTPVNHIRYSLILALAILSGATLWWKRFFLKYKWERHLILVLTVFMFLFIHLLSVRSGLLVLYASMFFLSLRFMFLSKRYLLGVSMIAGMILMPFIAIKTIPSLQTKFNYMRYDFEQYLKGNNQNHSDAERFVSMEVGLKIGNQNPLIGVGAGDLKKEVKSYYKKEYPNIIKPKMPHNQLISIYAGSGIVGLIFCLLAFFYPLWYRQNYRNTFFAILHVIIFCSFFIENTLETAIGVALYILFLMIGLNHMGRESH